MNRIILTPLIALWGGATLLAMSGASIMGADILVPAMIGAALAGALMAPLFARPHPFWTFAAPILTTTLGAALAGASVGWPSDVPLGLVFGPLSVWTGMAQEPGVLLVWLVGAVIVRLIGYSLK